VITLAGAGEAWDLRIGGDPDDVNNALALLRGMLVDEFNADNGGVAQIRVNTLSDVGPSDIDVLYVNVGPLNDQPIANAQSITADEDVPLEITLTGEDGDSEVTQTLTYFLDTLPGNGAIYGSITDAKNRENALTEGAVYGYKVWYMSAANDHTDTSFDFSVQDDGGTENGGDDASAPAAVDIRVNSVNDAPVAADFDETGDEDEFIVVVGWNFTDPNDDNPANEGANVVITTTPSNGALYWDSDNDGSFETLLGADDAVDWADAIGGRVAYLGDKNWHGDHSFSYAVTDDGGTDHGGEDTSGNEGAVSITVESVNDAPVAGDFTESGKEDSTVVIDGWRFSDPEDAAGPGGANSPQSVWITSLPANGTLYFDADDDGVAEAGDEIGALDVPYTVSWEDATVHGRVLFVPTPNWFGTTTLECQVQDDGGVTNSGNEMGPCSTAEIAVSPSPDNVGDGADPGMWGEGHYLSWLTPVGNDLYFTADDGSGYDLWVHRADGTTEKVADDSDPGMWCDAPWVGCLTSVGNDLYFMANDGDSSDLWVHRADGTTENVADAEGSWGVGNRLFQFAGVANSLYFFAADGIGGSDLWVHRADGTTAKVADDSDPGMWGDGIGITALTGVGNDLYFVAYDGLGSGDLWCWDRDPIAAE
jgi:hypothetical protein